MLLVKTYKTFVQQPGIFFQNTGSDFHAGRLQFFNAFSIYLFKRIAATDDHLGYIFFDNEVGTGRCFTEMSTGLQGNIQRVEDQMSDLSSSFTELMQLTSACGLPYSW